MWAGWIIAGVLLALLIGQWAAGSAHYFVSVTNPRPLDEFTMVIVIKGWGIASQSSLTGLADTDGLGFADIRLFATRKQLLMSFLTLGFHRPVTVAWRAHAGIYPLGDA